MMNIRKFLNLALIAFCFISFLSADENTDRRKEFGFKGSVSNCVISEVGYYHEFGETKKYVEDLLQEYSFSREGRLLLFSKVYYGVPENHKYTYDSEGRLIEAISYVPEARQPDRIQITNQYKYFYQSEGSLLKKTSYSLMESKDFPQYIEKFDSLGNLVDLTAYKPTGEIDYKEKYRFENNLKTEYIQYNAYGALSGKIFYEYDRQEKLKRYIRYASDGSVRSKVEYSYDSSGNVVSETFYNSGNTMTAIYTSVYADNRLVEYKQQDSKGAVTYLDQYKYDRSGNLINEKNYRNRYAFRDRRDVETKSNYLKTEKSFSYDSSGNRASQEQITYYIDGVQQDRWVEQYNRQGLVVGEEAYTSDDTLKYMYRYDYDFDSRGNWISRRFVKLSSSGGMREETLEKVEVREISYH